MLRILTTQLNEVIGCIKSDNINNCVKIHSVLIGKVTQVTWNVRLDNSNLTFIFRILDGSYCLLKAAIDNQSMVVIVDGIRTLRIPNSSITCENELATLVDLMSHKSIQMELKIC